MRPPLRVALSPFARALERNDMRLLGIERTQRIARVANRRRGPLLRARRRLYETRFDELLTENSWADGSPRLELSDGYVRDDSRSLPHLDALLAEMNEVIEERGGRKWEDWGKDFLRNILAPDAHRRYASLIDFGTSSEVLEPICHSFGYIPNFSTWTPRGIRLQESTLKFDPEPGPPWRQSQFWHRDYHTDPTIYLITLIREVTDDCGPLHYLGAEASRRVSDAYGYRRRGVPYRLSDEMVERVVSPDEVMKLTGPPGTTLIIDSSACFHYGSRNPVVPRYQVQYAYASPVKSDFADLRGPRQKFPVGPGDSTLRRLICDRDWLPPDLSA